MCIRVHLVAEDSVRDYVPEHALVHVMAVPLHVRHSAVAIALLHVVLDALQDVLHLVLVDAVPVVRVSVQRLVVVLAPLLVQELALVHALDVALHVLLLAEADVQVAVPVTVLMHVVELVSLVEQLVPMAVLADALAQHVVHVV